MRAFGIISILCFLLLNAHGEEITPPFGLQWGESETRIADLLKGASATIVDKKMIDGREAWEVEGLIRDGLKRAVFYFKSGSLVEVELQYENQQWDVSKYNDFMSQVRRKIDQKYGTGKLIARSKGPEADVEQTVVGYKWSKNQTAIQLIYFSAEKASEIYRSISVHYKTL